MKKSLYFKSLALCAGVLLATLTGCGKYRTGYDATITEDILTPEEKTLILRNSEEIRKQNRALVKHAIEAMTPGQRITVDETVEDQCGPTDSRYALVRVGDQLKLETSIALSPGKSLANDAARFQAGVDKTRACIPRFQEYFRRYGVELDLKFEIDDGSMGNRSVGLERGDGRSDSSTFYLKDPSYCSMVLHEVGHYLGLGDEYFEPGTCRSLEAASKDEFPWSLMDTHDAPSELFPRHFATLLGPVHDRLPPMRTSVAMTVKTDLEPTAVRDSDDYYLFHPFDGRDESLSLNPPIGACMMIVGHPILMTPQGIQVVGADTRFLRENEVHILEPLRPVRLKSGKLAGTVSWRSRISPDREAIPYVDRMICTLEAPTWENLLRALPTALALEPITAN